ncbi:MAG: YbaK/EbsC family protein [Nitrososphaeria archaeon]
MIRNKFVNEQHRFIGAEKVDDRDLQDYINRNKLDAKILYFDKPTVTVEDAEKQLKIGKERIIKSILLMNEKGQPILVIVNGDKKVSFDKVSRVVGTNVRIAKMKEVKEVLGYEVGAVPPIGHKSKVITLLDLGTLKYGKVVGGGGRTSALLEIDPRDVLKLNDAKFCDVSE